MSRVTLVEALNDPKLAQRVIAESAQILEEEVRAKRGLSGAAIRAGFKAFQKLKPGILTDALERLLPAFAPVIDPFVSRGREDGDLRRYFGDHAGEIADALLAVTDDKAARSPNRVLVRIYRSLRGPARGHVMAGVPRIADLILRFDS